MTALRKQLLLKQQNIEELKTCRPKEGIYFSAFQ